MATRACGSSRRSAPCGAAPGAPRAGRSRRWPATPACRSSYVGRLRAAKVIAARSSPRSVAEQVLVEEADHAAVVLRGCGRDPGDVLAVRDLPDLLRLAGGGVEALVRLRLGAALAVLAVDEEAGRRSDSADLALQWPRGE